MPSAVLDVNVLISAMIMRRGFPYLLLSAWRTGRFMVVASEHIITQLTIKLRSDKLRHCGVTTGDLRTVASSPHSGCRPCQAMYQPPSTLIAWPVM